MKIYLLNKRNAFCFFSNSMVPSTECNPAKIVVFIPWTHTEHKLILVLASSPIVLCVCVLFYVTFSEPNSSFQMECSSKCAVSVRCSVADRQLHPTSGSNSPSALAKMLDPHLLRFRTRLCTTPSDHAFRNF